MPSHLDDPESNKSKPAWVRDFHVYGNSTADKLASIGAVRGQLDSAVALEHKSKMNKIKHIQNRIAAVMSIMPPRNVKHKTAEPKPAKLTVQDHIDQSLHSIRMHGDRLICVLCERSSSNSPDTAIKFCKSECGVQIRNSSLCRMVEGGVQIGSNVTHSSHTLLSYRGVYFCKKCGNYATVKLIKLAEPCTGKPNGHGKLSLVNIAKGRLPPKLMSWPCIDLMTQAEKDAMYTVARQVQDLAKAIQSDGPHSDEEVISHNGDASSSRASVQAEITSDSD